MEEVCDLLQAWGLPELQSIFMKNEINLQSLTALSDDDIKELLPLVGPRTLFIRCWRNWKTDFLGINNNSMNCNLNDISLSDITILQELSPEPSNYNIDLSQPPQRAPSLVSEPNACSSSECMTEPLFYAEDNDLLKLLKDNFEASGLLNFLGKALDNENSRNLLASVIVKKILQENKNLPITKSIYHKWSKEIKALFPKERITAYYIPPCVTAQGITFQARGKLVSQLLNLRRRYQKQGVLDVKEKKPIILDNADLRSSPRPLPKSIEELRNTSHIEEDIAWLKSSSDPWTLVQSKWNGTLQKRSQDLRLVEYSIEQYFKEYPALQKPQGYTLLIEDFNNTYKEHINNFYLNFPSVKTKLIDLLKKKKSKDIYCNDIIHLADDSSEERGNLAAILSLTELISTNIVTLPIATSSRSKYSKKEEEIDGPTTEKKKKILKDKWKPTKAESRDAFVTQVADDSYLKFVITKRHQQTIEKGFTPQPYIVIVGTNLLTIKSYFVVVNPDTFYSCPNILVSVDTCFKVTWALNLEYSPPCYGPWFFIQKGLYKLSSGYDKGSTSVESLMTDCDLTT